MNKLKVWIKDYAHMLSYGAIMYFRHTPPKHYLGHVVEGKVPVIIVPGIFGRWGFLKSMGDHISLLGHPVYIVPKLGDNIHDVPSSAKKIRDVLEENNLKDVILVGHSKGGILGKYLLLNEDPEKRVKGVIAIASPFHGSHAGSFIPHSGIAELHPTSDIIKYLTDHIEVNNKIVSINPSYDNHVWHEQGSFLEGALENVNVDVAGHHTVLYDKKVWKIVVEWIEKITRL